MCLLPAIARLLEAETGETVLVPPHPQLMGAYGAALLALAKIGEPAVEA
jgi:activator of 2-hydroxyglutaryl-CoA dehydratase